MLVSVVKSAGDLYDVIYYIVKDIKGFSSL